MPNITLSLSPVVVEQLADPEFPRIFNEYLDEKIESAIDDFHYFLSRPHEAMYLPLAQYWHGWYTARKQDFNERYGTNLPGAFRQLMELDAVAVQSCGATHGYFALLSRDESIGAQIGVANAAHHRHFGQNPRGMWMPECAYRPSYYWTPPVQTSYAKPQFRLGVEQLLAEGGIEYTVVDSHLTRGGRPLSIYAERFHGLRNDHGQEHFLPLDDSRSVHDLYKICSAADPDAGTTTIFTRDASTTLQVWSGTFGYPGEPEYLEFHKKHHNSGHRYWRVTDSQVDLAMKGIYRPDNIGERIRLQAMHFVGMVEEQMRRYKEMTGREGTLTAPFDTELFGHWWFEGPRFLGEVIRRMSRSNSIRPRTAPAELDAKDPNVVIQIPEGSWGEGGDHRVWLNHQTAWTWPMIYEIEARFLGLLETLDPEDLLAERAMKQFAREQLLLQASDWQFLITTASASDYASKRFVEHYENARFLAEFVEGLRSGRPTSIEEFNQLRNLESVNRLFPNIDLNHWRRSR